MTVLKPKPQSWHAMFRPWRRHDDKLLAEMFYAHSLPDEIGTVLNRQGIEIVLRLIEIGIVAPAAIDMVWNGDPEATNED